MGVQKHYKKRFTKNRVEKVSKKIDKKSQTGFLPVGFNRVFGRLSVRGVPNRKNKILKLGIKLELQSIRDQAHALNYMHKFDQFSLTYFDGRGLAEVTRTLFATVGRYPGSGFTDVRLTRDQFNEMKGKGELAKNLNRVPILTHNGRMIGQSSSINRYLAKALGLLGANEDDAAQIDSLCEHIVDIKSAWRKLVPYGKDMTDEETQSANKLWFDTPASPALDDRKERQLQWFLEQVERTLPGDGFAVGGRPSLADAHLFNMLGEHASEVLPASKAEPFGSLADTAGALAKYPKLLAVVHAFKNSPGMKHYLGNRGHMGF
jgi:glutathione S-transferase